MDAKEITLNNSDTESILTRMKSDNHYYVITEDKKDLDFRIYIDGKFEERISSKTDARNRVDRWIEEDNKTMTGKEKFKKVMHEFKKGTLESNDSRVTDRSQAIAIAYSEARTVEPGYGENPHSLDHVKAVYNSWSDEGESNLPDKDEVIKTAKRLGFTDIESHYLLDSFQKLKSPEETWSVMEEQHKDKKPSEIWNDLSEEKRNKFFKKIGKGNLYVNRQWDMLPEDIKQEFVGYNLTKTAKSMKKGKIKQHVESKKKSKLSGLMGPTIEEEIQMENEEKEKAKLNLATVPPIVPFKSAKIYYNGQEIDGGQTSVELYYTLKGLLKDENQIKKIVYDSIKYGDTIENKSTKEEIKVDIRRTDDNISTELEYLDEWYGVKKETKKEMEYIKINDLPAFAAHEFVHYGKLMDLKKAVRGFKDKQGDKVIIYESTPELKDFINAHGIHATVFESREDLNQWLQKNIIDKHSPKK